MSWWEVIRREIRRRCLKLCKLHNPEFFTPCFVPHFAVANFGNILFKFGVALMTKVISWFILMNSSFFDSSRPLMAGHRQPIIRYAKTKSFPRDIKKFINATAIHHDLGRFWDVFNIDWWKFVQFSLLRRHPSRCGWGDVVKTESIAKGMNALRSEEQNEISRRVSVVEKIFVWQPLANSASIPENLLFVSCFWNVAKWFSHESDIHFVRMLLRRVWITLEDKQSEECALNFICSSFGSPITTV